MSFAVEPRFDTDTTDRLLRTTRAVRRRLDLQRDVDVRLILECIALATHAPSGGNRQGWRWLVVTDAQKRARLADLYREASLEKIAATRDEARQRGDAQTDRVYASAEYLAQNLHRVPVHVVACIEGRVDGADNATAAAFYGSILPAVWGFMLACRTRGLGTALTTFHLAREQQAADLLDIPPDISQVGLIPVAHTIGDDFTPARRRPVEDVTYLESWGVRP